jgi:tetratricopeptide (TPR) repeat protein
VTFDQALAAAQRKRDDEDALSDLGRAALAEGREEAALPLLRRAAESSRSALIWQWTGLLERSLDDHEPALASFGKAAALAPTDKSIAHGRARAALEGGVPAEALFEVALRLSPSDGDVLLGYAAALFAAGKLQAAEATLDHALTRSPLWTEGHMKLAQLRSRLGKRDQATASIETAIRQHPKQEQLWVTLFRLLLQSEQFDALDEAVARAREHLEGGETLLCYEAIAAAEQRDTARADRLFDSMSADLRRSVEIYRIRHLLRTGRVVEAIAAIDAALLTSQVANVWPYAAVAWRLAGDPRWQWLEGDLERLVSVIDLTPDLPELGLLEQTLRSLHVGTGEYLDQSVRGGSQTDGPLFSKIDPTIRKLRAAVVSAVEGHVQNLPPRDSSHPLLASARDRRMRFSGSWSVLLRGSGYHANHVHPRGWISSALYVRLPEPGAVDPPHASWLTLGEPQAGLGVDLPPLREVEPKPGRLVLFPSYMWHGTRPFATGERLTVAFDVQQPL